MLIAELIANVARWILRTAYTECLISYSKRISSVQKKKTWTQPWTDQKVFHILHAFILHKSLFSIEKGQNIYYGNILLYVEEWQWIFYLKCRKSEVWVWWRILYRRRWWGNIFKGTFIAGELNGYAKMYVDSYSDKSFSGYQSDIAQESWYEIGRQIQAEIVLCSLLKIVLSW